MEIYFSERGGIAVAAIRGSVDGLTSGALLDLLGEKVKAGHARLIADFAGVEYVSSAGLRALLATVKDARHRGGDLRIAAVRPEVRRVLDLSGFTSILKVFETVAQAETSFAGAPS